jgi:hypothetical protein
MQQALAQTLNCIWITRTIPNYTSKVGGISLVVNNLSADETRRRHVYDVYVLYVTFKNYTVHAMKKEQLNN